MDDADPDWLPWLTFFLRSLRKQKDHLVVKIEASKGWSGLPEDSVQILNHLTANERITIQQAETLTGTTRGTLKNRFNQLLEQGLIDRKGKARNTWYILKEK